MQILKTQKEKILVIFLFIIGILLRSQETFSRNFLFLLDQGRDMMAVKGILYDHHITLIGPNTSLQGVFQGPFWYYLLAIPTYVLNGDPWGGVILMLVFSLTVMFLSYYWTKRLFGYTTACVTLFFITICPEAIAAATFAWNPHPMWLLITIFIFLFYEINLGKNKLQILFWPIIALMFHFETALAFFIFISSVSYFVIFKRNILTTKFTLSGSIFAFIFFLPQIFFDVRHNFLMTKSVIQLFHGSNQGLLVRGETTHYLQIVKGHFGEFIINFNSGFQNSGLAHEFITGFLILFILSLIFAKYVPFLQNKDKQVLIAFGKFLFIIIFLLMLYPFPLRYWFLTGFELFFIFPLCLVISRLLYYTLGKGLGILYFFVIMIIIIPKIYNLYTYPDYGGVAKVKGKSDAIRSIYNDAQGKKFSLMIFSPPVYSDNYDYLIWYYARTEFHYIPPKEKKGTFYLLIEPDSGKPWSYNGWLDTVIKSGKILSTKTLNSGLIVQKREEIN